jgi:hypothetical protein
MSTVNPVPSNPSFSVDPNQVIGQHSHSGGGHKGGVQNAQNQQITSSQQQVPIAQHEELREILLENKTEKAHPDKHREEQDQDSQSSDKKSDSFKTKWRRARSTHLKI